MEDSEGSWDVICMRSQNQGCMFQKHNKQGLERMTVKSLNYLQRERMREAVSVFLLFTAVLVAETLNDR